MDDNSSVLAMTSDIVAAFVDGNTVAADDLPALIQSVHKTLTALSTGAVEAAPAEPLKPAVPIKKSVTPEAIYSLEDGKPYKSLKRHLRTKYNLSPEDYRTKWGLPKTYPMVAPNYAASRSELAKSLGLGRKPAAAAPTKGKKG